MLTVSNRREVSVNRFRSNKYMNLNNANKGETYIVKDILSDDDDLRSFLFTLGCYSGEPITVIAHVKGGCVVSIKNGRYNIDKGIAEAILI